MQHSSKQQTAGWVAVTLSTIITSFWAFWGIIENFHEGWYFDSWLSNLGLMLVQYLSPMLLFMGVTLCAILWPRIGAGLHFILALAAVWFFEAYSNAATFLIIVPLMGLGGLYWFGRPRPLKRAIYAAVALPLLTLLISAIEPVIRVSQRLDDGNLAARAVSGNGVDLIWAPAGPGWPPTGTDWYAAQQICQHLSEDGLTITPEPLSIWHLPTAAEAVHSMTRHGRNSGGIWDPQTAQATYETLPDKESPLWNTHSQVIYWWTATEVDADRAYIIAYDGQVWPRTKQFRPAYLGFRCVK